MSEPTIPLKINLKEWVDKAKSNPDKYIVRQVTEILLNAVGMTKRLRGNMFLKGGTLMAVAYHSERVTGDVDYSWLEPFAPTIDEEICKHLDDALTQASAKLGYIDIVCKIQSVKKEPKRWQTSEMSFPALSITIGYAKKNTAQEKALLEHHNASNVLRIDISFNETLNEAQELLLDESNVSVKSYTPIEIIAEKLRALLQQTQRKHERSRRQDIYDIDLLLEQFDFDDEEKTKILRTLKVKAESRHVIIMRESLADSAVKDAAYKEWNTMQLEVSEELPDFGECYARVQMFYESLPW